ncbi:hypothetical protein M758_1G008300 [Ceratodon purpureus]|uniref:Uncharacterized protein n=1 Tax=Ceratodon purpureus TaxID=3225 RepID=A0A8T0J227_CERPU|nr:hypothetical protein KC19_1G009700 [Ceratodon purpureus]KAG0628196.1 hypothetical protein M758_1G008300 [Ceratodon purpureus]
MKKRSLSISGRPGPLSHAGQSQFCRLIPIPGSCDVAPRPIESQRADSAQLADCGLQQESQSKHPFLARSGQPHSSQNQRLSLSQGCLTQSQSSQQFSQNSQPEDYGSDLWNRPGFLDKDFSLSQPKPPSPYFAGLTSSFNRRNVSGTVGGGSTPASSSGTSSALCVVAPQSIVGPQSSSPRPWPQCNVSEELEKRLSTMEKLREEDTALLQKICDDYQQIKIFLEETCFEGKDNRSKLALQQNALHKLLKEEETANSSILSAIKTSGEAILEDIRILKKSAEEADVVKKDIVSASFERMMESFREEVTSFKRELKAELDAMKKSAPITAALPQLSNQPVPITDMQHQLRPNQSSHPRMNFTESTPTQTLDRSSVPVSMPEVVDLDELPDFDIQNRSSRPISTLGVVDLDTFSDFNIDTGFAYSLARVDVHPACNGAVASSLTRPRTKTKTLRLKKYSKITDEDIEKLVQGKVLRAQRRVRYKGMC